MPPTVAAAAAAPLPRVPTIVVAGTHSGVGKTTVAVGVMAALRARGLRVAPFKVGPDFLDCLHHAEATGARSVNLDGFLMTRAQTSEAFARAVEATAADVAVVEGCMGLYDSRDGASEDGSTAQVAKWLGAPVVLVLDCWALARSAAAVVKGYAEFDRGLAVAGVAFNRVGGAAHARWLADAVRAADLGVCVLGGVPKVRGGRRAGEGPPCLWGSSSCSCLPARVVTAAASACACHATGLTRQTHPAFPPACLLEQPARPKPNPLPPAGPVGLNP